MANRTRWNKASIRARLKRLVQEGVDPKCSTSQKRRDWNEETLEACRRLGIELPKPHTVTNHVGSLGLLVEDIKAELGTEAASEDPITREELLRELVTYHKAYGEFPQLLAGNTWCPLTQIRAKKVFNRPLWPVHYFAYHFGTYGHAREAARASIKQGVGDWVYLEIAGVPTAYIPGRIVRAQPLTLKDATGQVFRPKHPKVLTAEDFARRMAELASA